MKTRHIGTALTGTILALASLGALAGHDQAYRYNAESDTIDFTHHDRAVAAGERRSDSGPHHEVARDRDDSSFLDL